MVKAHWSGSYPCLCYGEWTLIVNGRDVTEKLPKDLRESDMNTYGTYQRWFFNGDWIEEFEDYEDGLDCEDWIAANKEWLDTITTDYDTQQEIYNAINAEDFRAMGCGGCI